MASTAITIRDFRHEIPGQLTLDGMRWEFPLVEFTNANGKIQQQNIYVELFASEKQKKILDKYYEILPEDVVAHIVSISGQKDGKKTTATHIVEIGKNLGKKNETNAFTQALRDALRKYNLQEKKTRNKDVVPEGRYPPMLVARDMKLHFDKEAYFIQPKLDGIRTIARCTGMNVELYSRTCRDFLTQTHINKELKQILCNTKNKKRFGNLYLDGEMYKHGMKLQDISGASRNTEEQTAKLEYFIFDCFDPTKPDLKYEERKIILQELGTEFAEETHLKLVATYEINSENDKNFFYQQFLDEKYEGAIIRKGSGKYVFSYGNYRSRELMKLKPYLTNEYEIVGYVDGNTLKGRAKDTIVWICKVNDYQFRVVPNATEEERKQLYKDAEVNFEQYRGKMLTVQYSTISKNGVPQQPKGIVIRDYE